jgi:hypothetical protein
MAAGHALNPRALEPILRRYLAENEQLLWSDALRRYDLV